MIWNFLFLFAALVFASACNQLSEIPREFPEGTYFLKKQAIYVYETTTEKKIWSLEKQLYADCKILEPGREDCKYFLPSSGLEIARGSLKNGWKIGFWSWDLSEGTPYYRMNYEYGKSKSLFLQTTVVGNENGDYKRYYRNTNLDESGSYVAGEKNGLWTKYFPDQKLEYKGSYSNGKKIGEWVYFYPSGILEAKEMFSNSGEFLRRDVYFPNGTLWSTRTR